MGFWSNVGAFVGIVAGIAGAVQACIAVLEYLLHKSQSPQHTSFQTATLSRSTPLSPAFNLPSNFTSSELDNLCKKIGRRIRVAYLATVFVSIVAILSTIKPIGTFIVSEGISIYIVIALVIGVSLSILLIARYIIKSTIEEQNRIIYEYTDGQLSNRRHLEIAVERLRYGKEEGLASNR